MPHDYLIRSTINAPATIAGEPAQVSEKITTERLVRAKNQARAIAHIVKDSIVATVAGTDDVIRLTAANVKLETDE